MYHLLYTGAYFFLLFFHLVDLVEMSSDSELEGATGVSGVGSVAGAAAAVEQEEAVVPEPFSVTGDPSNVNGAIAGSQTNTGGDGFDQEKDLAGTCAIIVKMIRTCNWQLPSLGDQARSIVKKMNFEVMSIIKGHMKLDVGYQGDESSDNSDDEPPARVKSRMRQSGTSMVAEERKLFNNISNTSGSSTVSVEQLTDILSKFDRRTVPRPEPYDMASGHNFIDFLELFEEYCTNSYCGSSRLWVGELGRLLDGDMAVAFNALRSPSDSYEDIKAKLCQWHSESGDLRIKERKKNFSEAMRHSSETTRLYAARLEKLFKLAYPRKNIDSSRTLRDKFCKTVPSALQQQISMMRNVGLSMQKSDISWPTIIVLAGAFDRENCASVYEGGSSSVFVGAVSSRISVSDAMTQYDTRGSSTWPTNQTERTSRPTSRGPSSERGGSRNAASSRNKTCFYCKKVGHIKEECRRLKGLCLGCGSPDHIISNCPSREVLLQKSRKMLPNSDSGEAAVQVADLSQPPPGYHPVSNGNIKPGYSGGHLN